MESNTELCASSISEPIELIIINIYLYRDRRADFRVERLMQMRKHEPNRGVESLLKWLEIDLEMDHFSTVQEQT